MDVTQSMEYNEREKYSTMLLTAWIAKWLCVFPEGRDESPEGDPQQLPDSGRYRPKPEQQTIKDVYPTAAKAREKEGSEGKWQSTCGQEKNHEDRRPLR
jgi:hypothetical protein